MDIDTYGTVISWIYLGTLSGGLLAVIAAIVLRIRHRPLRRDWLAPYVVLYAIGAWMETIMALIAYDDVASPNYHIYKGWQLHHFVLNDIRMLMVWASLGVVLDGLFRRGRCGVLKTVIWALLAVMAGTAAYLLMIALRHVRLL